MLTRRSNRQKITPIVRLGRALPYYCASLMGNYIVHCVISLLIQSSIPGQNWLSRRRRELYTALSKSAGASVLRMRGPFRLLASGRIICAALDVPKFLDNPMNSFPFLARSNALLLHPRSGSSPSRRYGPSSRSQISSAPSMSRSTFSLYLRTVSMASAIGARFLFISLFFSIFVMTRGGSIF